MDMMLKAGLLACGLVLLVPGCWMLCYCKKPWTHHGESCWLVTSNTMQWCQAIAYCLRQGARLAIPNNEAESKFLAKQIPGGIGKGWLGALCEESDCHSIYTTRMLDFVNWDHDQPDGFKEIAEDCVALHDNGFWHDYPCCHNFHMAAICEKD